MIIRNSTCCNVCEISLLSPVSLSYTPSPLERTSKKGNANKSQINWKAKKKKSMRPLTSRRRGDDYLIFFFGFFCFLVRGAAEPDCRVVTPASTHSEPCGRSESKSLWPVVLLPQQSQAHADEGETSRSWENQNRCEPGQREWVTSGTSLSSHALNIAWPVPTPPFHLQVVWCPNQGKVLERLGWMSTLRERKAELF